VWVELLLALIVEGYREFMEWWQTRAWWRPRELSDDGSEELDDGDRVSAAGGARAGLVGVVVAGVLGRHASKHVGVAVENGGAKRVPL